MMKRSAAWLLGLCLLTVLASCGNKGPLELPAEETEKRERSTD